jgi:ABC-type transport system involved in multi-copper enzyme maturation permease subunit
MILRIALFELRYQLRRPLAWMIFLFFALLTWGATSSDVVQMGGAIGNVHRNAPSVIIQQLAIMSYFGLLITTIFVAGAILRDFDHQTHELVLSCPIRRRDYLLGRFVGACLISFTVFSGTAFGSILGGMMPWLDPERLGPFSVSAYAYALFVMALPTLFFSACVFFSLASLTRSMLATYMGVVGLLVAYFVSQTILSDLDSRYLAALLDPFGLGAFGEATRYWTIVERNAALPELAGPILQNRLLWAGIGVVVLALAALRFRPSSVYDGRRGWRDWLRRRKPAARPAAELALAGASPAAERPAPVPRTFGFETASRQLVHQARVEVRGVFKSPTFLIMLAFGLFNLLAAASFMEMRVGTPVYPVTRLMLEAVEGAFAFLLLIIITFYSGELIWKERSVKLAEVFDSMPVPDWVYLGAKLFAQMLVVIAFISVGVVATIGFQAYHGYHHFELPLYLQGALLIAVPYFLLCVLASFMQVIGSKFVGYLLMVLYLMSTIFLGVLDYDHRLYQYADPPRPVYSDMNGFGHYLEPYLWFNLYWTFGAAILVGLAVLFWRRGTEGSWRDRWRVARDRFRGPIRWALPLAAALFAVTGGWIFYNTNVLNEYVPDDLAEERQAGYEKQFRQYKDVALPRVTAVKVDVDIYPTERRIEARGRYRLVNRGEAPLAELHVSIPRRTTVRSLDFPPHTQTLADEVFGYSIYRLETPLPPGGEMDFAFDLAVENPGFVNNDPDDLIAANGTFFNNRQYFPSFGYSEDAELRDPNDRRKHGLPPANRMADVADLRARRNHVLANDSDWVDFETTVSTRADQIAIAPGYLQREWTEDGRRYFHYEMDAPILHFYSYLSADYTVERDRWRDVDIEIFYHRPHAFNVDRMIDSIKKSLEYFTADFGPYQHRQMRIIEFPRYATFAQSFPNTVPYSEAIGFIARLDEDDEDAIDFPFYVTAHEVAHQWWAHQVISGNVQGATMLAETMSQYSALLVMEREYGAEKMRRFLKYELDQYLGSRSQELVEEMPLLRVENQPYIHYRKGSVAMYALRDHLGEETLNRAIRRYADAVRFQEPPYTNTVELFDVVREGLPSEQLRLIDDLFEHITLFENRVEEASFSERGDGKYVVTLAAKARKVRADGQGVETEVPIDDWIDVGVFGEELRGGERRETVLLLEKRHVTEPEMTFELVVDERPVRAGIDPYNKLVDRNSDDNVKRVKQVALTEPGEAATGG